MPRCCPPNSSQLGDRGSQTKGWHSISLLCLFSPPLSEVVAITVKQAAPCLLRSALSEKTALTPAINFFYWDIRGFKQFPSTAKQMARLPFSSMNFLGQKSGFKGTSDRIVWLACIILERRPVLAQPACESRPLCFSLVGPAENHHFLWAECWEAL